MPRFLFYVPETPTPSGGVNVILDLHEHLVQAGFESFLICERPDYRYSFVTPEPVFRYEPRIARSKPAPSRRERVLRAFRHLRRKRVHQQLDLRHDDVILVPEFASDWVPNAFPNQVCILIVQGYRPLADAAIRPGWDRSRFLATIATSTACEKMAGLLSMKNIRSIPLHVDAARFRPGQAKLDVMAYMPRRRHDESRAIVGLLKDRDALKGYTFRAIENMTHQEVGRSLADARFFLSFSQTEGFGLPPAEAMAAECLVVGYTGVGGVEYFDDETGIPVMDGDFLAFVQSVEASAVEYAASPARLDAMRKLAGERIRTRYGIDGQRDATVKIFTEFSQLHADLKAA